MQIKQHRLSSTGSLIGRIAATTCHYRSLSSVDVQLCWRATVLLDSTAQPQCVQRNIHKPPKDNCVRTLGYNVTSRRIEIQKRLAGNPNTQPRQLSFANVWQTRVLRWHGVQCGIPKWVGSCLQAFSYDGPFSYSLSKHRDAVDLSAGRNDTYVGNTRPK